MNKKILTLFMLLFGMVLLAGCDNDDDPVTLTGISTSPASVPDGLPIGVSQQFTATGSYSNGSVQDLTATVTWSSSAPATASVDANGLATGQAVGTANITASSSGVASNAVAVQVIDPTLQTITIAPPVVTDPLAVGRSMSFTAEGVFDNNQSYDVTDYVTWNSSNPGIATIIPTGRATAHAEGTTNISASAGVSSNIVALTTKVQPIDPDNDILIIEPQSLDPIPVGRDKQLVAVLIYADGSKQIVNDTANWVSSNTQVATVDTSTEGSKGLVIARNRGSTEITATDLVTGLISEPLIVEVNEATLETVTVTPENPADLPAGATQAFVALGEFSDNITRILSGLDTWSVSNTNYASIREEFDVNRGGPIGLVRGEAPGTVSVEYRDALITGQRTGVEGSTDLTVSGGLLQTIEVWPTPDAIPPADAGQVFSAFGLYGGGDNRYITDEVIWTSSNQAVGVFDPAIKGLLITLPGTAGRTTIVIASMLNTANPPVNIVSPTTTVAVNNAVLEYLTINPQNPTVFNVPVQLEAIAVFSNQQTRDFTERVTWTVDALDADIATVSNAPGSKGQVTGLSPGVARIWVKDPSTTEEASTEVTVSQ